MGLRGGCDGPQMQKSGATGPKAGQPPDLATSGPAQRQEARS